MAAQGGGDALRAAAEQAVLMMEKAKRLLKAAGLTMEGGTISGPYGDALDALRTAFAHPAPPSAPDHDALARHAEEMANAGRADGIEASATLVA